MTDELTFIDLFSGVGGLSLGFEMAGARSLGAIEFNETHAYYYAQNRETSVFVETTPIEDIDAATFLRATGARKRDLDLIIGGPPCQPFSNAGKRNGRRDERGNLVRDFIRFVEDLKPRVFLMENVVGLQSIHNGEYLNTAEGRLRRAGYRCERMILDAALYGVPQHRRRLFLIGSRLNAVDVSRPHPTHGQLGSFFDSKAYVTVRDAITDLPSAMGDLEVDDFALLEYLREPTEYQKLMRECREGVTGNGTTKHVPHILKAISRSALPEGAVEPSTRYRRLRWDAPAVTLRAGSGTFTALRPIHPEHPRVITVREAARLQSFPDRFEFALSRKLAHQQIGNSVPPLLAEAIAKKLLSTLGRRRGRTEL